MRSSIKKEGEKKTAGDHVASSEIWTCGIIWKRKRSIRTQIEDILPVWSHGPERGREPNEGSKSVGVVTSLVEISMVANQKTR